MSASTPHSVPHEPGRWRAVALAAVVHAALFAFLWFGIRWQNEKPLAVEAEIWSPNTQEAAPLVAQKIPEPQPVQPPEKTLEKPAPVPEPVVATPPAAKPDIALEQEKKRKARQEEQEREQLAKKRHAQEILKEQQAQKEAAHKQAEKEKEKEKEKALAQEKKRKQELAKAALAAEDAELAKLRDENLRRMTGDSGSSASGSGGAGTAAKSQGSRGDPGYGERIKAKIKSNTIFNVPSDLKGNPEAIYEVSLLPDGTIRSLRLKKSSGVTGFDEAVKRGIEKSEPYPKDKSGEVPPSFELTYKPKD